MSTLTELRDRVAALKGPDREVDEAVFMLDRGYTRLSHDPYDSAGPRCYAWSEAGYVGEINSRFPAYTASVDAVLSLIERTLPGWFWDVALGIEVDGDGPYWAELYDLTTDRGHFDGDPNEYGGRTPALALLLALLEAKSSGETS